MSQALRVPKPVNTSPDSFPRWVLYCGAGIMAFSLISVGLIRITGNGPDQRAAGISVRGAGSPVPDLPRSPASKAAYYSSNSK